MRRRKASLHISLVLIGAAGLGGCGPSDPELRRPVYASLEDCRADWGNSVAEVQADAKAADGSARAAARDPCETVAERSTTNTGGTSGTHSSTTRYYGPYYWSHGDSTNPQRPHPNSRAIGAVSAGRSATATHGSSSPTARGGFGASSAAHASGSSS